MTCHNCKCSDCKPDPPTKWSGSGRLATLSTTLSYTIHEADFIIHTKDPQGRYRVEIVGYASSIEMGGKELIGIKAGDKP